MKPARKTVTLTINPEMYRAVQMTLNVLHSVDPSPGSSMVLYGLQRAKNTDFYVSFTLSKTDLIQWVEELEKQITHMVKGNVFVDLLDAQLVLSFLSLLTASQYS